MFAFLADVVATVCGIPFISFVSLVAPSVYDHNTMASTSSTPRSGAKSVKILTKGCRHSFCEHLYPWNR